MRTTISAVVAVLMCVTAALAVSFTDSGNGTVTDTTTNLMWQQCSAGLVSSATCTSTPTPAGTYVWEAAISYCEALSLGGFTDWRLPNIKELRSIVDSSTVNPAINATYFPNTTLFRYWSSTSYAANTNFASYVNFDLGTAGALDKTTLYSVRCVRGQ